MQVRYFENSAKGLERGQYLGKTETLVDAQGVTASITTYPDITYSEDAHYHENSHASFVVRGGNLEKRFGKEIERTPGVATFYNAGEVHQSTGIRPNSCHVNLEMDHSFYRQYDIDLGSQDNRLMKTPDAALIMVKILKELTIADTCSVIAIHSLALDLLQRAAQQVIIGSKPCWVKTVNEIIHDRWDENISLLELSKTTGIHPVTISKMFPKYFGYNIGEYMRKIKIARSIELMATSPKSLTQISACCGFADQSHFIRTFKKETCFVPGRLQQIVIAKNIGG